MDIMSTLLAAFASAFSQTNRLFSLNFAESWLDAELLPHTLSGKEHVSEPFRFIVECLSSDTNIALKELIGQGVDIVIHRDDNDRTISGVVTRAQQLGSDGGFARYGLTVEPALAALKLRKNSRVFQDKSVIDIVGLILDEHIQNNPLFAQCFRHKNLLTQTYPPRSFCQQYRESDFDFISRLLREEGISYYFDFEHDADEIGLHTLVFFDAGSELQTAPHDTIRFHRADATEKEDSITDWRASRQIQSGSAQVASFDYKGVYTQLGSDKTVIDHGDSGSGLAYSLENYDPQSLYYGADNSELNRYARLHQQANDLRSKTFNGSGVVRGLGAGQIFALTDHPNHDCDNEFVVLSQTLEARNNLPGEFDSHPATNIAAKPFMLDQAGYRNDVEAVRKHIPIVPAYTNTDHAKPTARGIQSATVVGPAGEEIYTDELGRIKIQFHWARPQDHDTGKHGAGANKDDFSSCWVRVQQPSAGAQWGHQFIPRIGQEVLVDFIEGDIDRPVVTHAIHNGQQTPPTFQNAGSLPANKTLSGIKSREYKSGRHNELVFDDTTNEIRTALSTEHGKTQLNQGYLIHPRSEGKGAPRGEGFELRTDNAGAVRSAQGLLVTTEPQQNARGKQLDRSPALAQLEAAQNLTQQLGDVAQNQRANKPTLNPALNADQLKDKKPHILMHGHGGAAITTPQSTLIATGKDLNQVSLRDTNQTSGRRWIHNAGESISLFVVNAQNKIKTAIKLLAAKGDILIQAQKGDVEITADKKINITACKEKLTASAGKEFLLQSGGGYIKISGGNVEIHCPGKLSMKAKNFVHTSGGGGGSVDAPRMPNDDYNPIKPDIAGFDNTTFLGGMANGVLNQLAVVTSKIARNDGRIVQPFTGVEVSKPDQQDAAFNNLVGLGGVASKLAAPAANAAEKVVYAGLHNQSNLAVNVPRGSFKTLRKVDMENLSPADNAAKNALSKQGWKPDKVQEVLESGSDFKITTAQRGDKLYGFNTAGKGKDVNTSAYWLDEAGYKDVQAKFFKEGSWDKEGVKNYVALPCYNRANAIDTAEVTETTTLVQAKISKATELIKYSDGSGYTTGTMGKIMSGGGLQSTANPSALKLIGK